MGAGIGGVVRLEPGVAGGPKLEPGVWFPKSPRYVPNMGDKERLVAPCTGVSRLMVVSVVYLARGDDGGNR